MRKTLALLLTAVILTAFLWVPGWADETYPESLSRQTESVPEAVSVKVYRVGKDGMTLRGAFASVPTDGTPVTVLLTESVTYSDRVTVPAGADVTLDLNGCKMKYQGTVARANIYVNGRLTVTGGGGMENSLFSSSAHIFAVNAGGVLDVRSGTFLAYGGDTVHITGGTLENVSGGSFTSMMHDAISCAGTVGSVSGGSFTGKRALILYYGAHADRIDGGTFRGSSCAVFVKKGASVGRIGQAHLQSQTGSVYTFSNSGTVDEMDGTTVVCMQGTGAIVNYGYIKEMKNVSASVVSKTRGSGCGVFNARGTVDAMDVHVTANAIGVWNKGGTVGRLTGSVTSDHGFGVYQNYAGSIGELNMDITSYNRACIRNVSNSRIERISGGHLVADRENRRCPDVRCIAIYNMSGAEIGTIDGVQAETHGACIGNSGGVIREIAGGSYASDTRTVVNINGGRIYTVSGGTYNIPFDGGLIG